jgi:hypothetical protein
MADSKTHRWQFAARFRRNAFGWRSQPAIERVHEAVAEITAGERRILTALAQYPQGRSKVQVAVLTGYAATGGGFNNYLGALRSRGLSRAMGTVSG